MLESVCYTLRSHLHNDTNDFWAFSQNQVSGFLDPLANICAGADLQDNSRLLANRMLGFSEFGLRFGLMGRISLSPENLRREYLRTEASKNRDQLPLIGGSA